MKVLSHCIPHFPLKFRDIPRSKAKLKAALNCFFTRSRRRRCVAELEKSINAMVSGSNLDR